MADPVEILVKNDPKATQQKGDWTVKIGRGRGGKNVSSHRSKASAVQRGRREGRKRSDNSGGAILKVQNSRGRWRTEAKYGDAQQRRGIFGLFS